MIENYHKIYWVIYLKKRINEDLRNIGKNFLEEKQIDDSIKKEINKNIHKK